MPALFDRMAEDPALATVDRQSDADIVESVSEEGGVRLESFVYSVLFGKLGNTCEWSGQLK